jgi:hypothetical protein
MTELQGWIVIALLMACAVLLYLNLVGLDLAAKWLAMIYKKLIS